MELKDQIKTNLDNLGYEYEQLADDAFLVHNILSEEERQAFHNLANETLPPQWYFFYLKELEEKAKDLYGRVDIATLISEGKLMLIPRNMSQVRSTEEDLENEVTALTNRVNEIMPPEYPTTRYGVMQRHYKGVGLEDHRDTDCNPSLEFATVVYLNENYEGGYLYFKDDDLTTQIKPPAGSMMLFRASRLHGVTEVTSEGQRYVLTSFISHVAEQGNRFDSVNMLNPTDGKEMGYVQEKSGYKLGSGDYQGNEQKSTGDPALDHFLSQGYAGSGKKGNSLN
jgi:predicted 2-oxoglutarate/Fe(II)-dependent dioxygenase YbiX